MMQSYASAAKLRSGGPILPFGIESQGNTSGLRHLEPSSATRHQWTDRAETVGCPSVTSVHYAGLTGSPDESGRKRREKGLAPRVRRGMIQLAWRFLMFQKDSALAQWFRARTESARGTRKTMIVALARKILIALWRLVREGVVPDGVVLRPA